VRASDSEPIDEIEEYWKARYLTAVESTWRILGFNITGKSPAVSGLPVHLPDDLSHRPYATRRGIPAYSSSMLDHYFLRPFGVFNYQGTTRRFDNITYNEYWSLFRTQRFDPNNNSRPNYFCEHATIPGQPLMHVILRSESHRHITRLQVVRVSEGERFYLRRLLQYHAAYSFDELKTIHGTLYPTFQDATNAAGLFAEENEAEYTLQEAIARLSTPRQLRFLFIDLILHEELFTPLSLWNRYSEYLAYDFTIRLHSEELGRNSALQEMGDYLQEAGKTLEQFGLPAVRHFGREVEHELGRWDSHANTLSERATHSFSMFNNEQQSIFLEVMHAVHENLPLYLFIDGKAGRGKTFLVNTICDYVRSLHKIVIPTATSGSAALLYPGGRTTHSTFKVILLHYVTIGR
jgi:hypothetical protein